MNRFELENLYEVNDLSDYKLKSTEDLLKVHGIEFGNVEGYDVLDDINRSIYEKFIVNFFNALGLESRTTLFPTGIYYVEDAELLVKEFDDGGEECCLVVGGVVKIIDKYGDRRVHRQWIDDDYAGADFFNEEPHRYLRFEYEHHGRNEWLHIIKEGKQWY